MTISNPMRINLGSTEAVDTERRAIWWFNRPGAVPGRLADRDEVREFLRARGQTGLDQVVSQYLDAGHPTARQEAERAVLPKAGRG